MVDFFHFLEFFSKYSFLQTSNNPNVFNFNCITMSHQMSTISFDWLAWVPCINTLNVLIMINIAYVRWGYRLKIQIYSLFRWFIDIGLVNWKMSWSRKFVWWTQSIVTRFSLELCIVQHFNHDIIQRKKLYKNYWIFSLRLVLIHFEFRKRRMDDQWGNL